MKMCASTLLVLMKDGSEGQIALERLECFLDRHQLQIIFPKFGGIRFGEIGPRNDLQGTATACAADLPLPPTPRSTCAMPTPARS